MKEITEIGRKLPISLFDPLPGKLGKLGINIFSNTSIEFDEIISCVQRGNVGRFFKEFSTFSEMN